MTRFVLEHGEGPRETSVSAPDELDALLDQITTEAHHAGRPELPTLYDEGGRSLAIGVGNPLSVLAWLDESTGDSLLSVGDLVEDDHQEVSFFYGNQYSFFPATALVPTGIAREAIRQFVTSEVRPTVVEWQSP